MSASRRALVFLFILALWLTPAIGSGQEKSESSFPLPRFVSLRADQVNLRTGPGMRYPVEWVFVRRGLPVEVIAEYDQWRKIRDIEGTVGWVHHSLLSGRRVVTILGEERTLFSTPDEAAEPVLRAEPGVRGDLLACSGPWCRVAIAGVDGWIPREQIWGVYREEQFP